jgi:8-oxo-dGTP diphosphatase
MRNMALPSALLHRVPAEVLRVEKLLPRFQDGRIDYTNARRAPVLDCYVFCKRRLLILKRTRPIAGSGNAWHVVSGFLDTPRSLREHVLQELREEINLHPGAMDSLFSLKPYRHFHAKLWTVYPVIARLDCDWPIRLNDEHVEFRWIHAAEIKFYLAPQVCRAIHSPDSGFI